MRGYSAALPLVCDRHVPAEITREDLVKIQGSTYEMAHESSTPISQAPTDASEDARQLHENCGGANHGYTLHTLHTHTGGSSSRPPPLRTRENTPAASLPKSKP